MWWCLYDVAKVPVSPDNRDVEGVMSILPLSSISLSCKPCSFALFDGARNRTSGSVGSQCPARVGGWAQLLHTAAWAWTELGWLMPPDTCRAVHINTRVQWQWQFDSTTIMIVDSKELALKNCMISRVTWVKGREATFECEAAVWLSDCWLFHGFSISCNEISFRRMTAVSIDNAAAPQYFTPDLDRILPWEPHSRAAGRVLPL